MKGSWKAAKVRAWHYFRGQEKLLVKVHPQLQWKNPRILDASTIRQPPRRAAAVEKKQVELIR